MNERRKESRGWICDLFAETNNSVGAEIGVWEGDFSQTLLECVSPKRFFLIDPWIHDPRHPDRWYGRGDQESMDERFESVQQRFRNKNQVTIIRARSDEVWQQLPSLNWIYIDGDHSFCSVLADLLGADSRLRVGGVIAGDDCYPEARNPRFPGVYQGLVEFLSRPEGANYNLERLEKGQFVIRKNVVTRAMVGIRRNEEFGEKVKDDRVASIPAKGKEKRGSFLVMSQPRCGTHLVRGYLNSHPDVHCDGEIFHPKSRRDFHRFPPEITTAEELFEGLRNESERSWFGILMHDHFGSADFKATYNWAHEQVISWRDRPKIIWLSRDDKLAQYASWKVAHSTNFWMCYEDSCKKTDFGAAKSSIGGFDCVLTPSPEEFGDWLEKWYFRREKLRAMFADFESISISYEELCRDPNRACARIFKMLNLLPVEVKPDTIKQRVYRVPRVFTNFEDLINGALSKHGREKVELWMGGKTSE